MLIDDHMREHLPGVEKAVMDGTFYFSSSKQVYHRSTAPTSKPATQEESSLVVFFLSSKCPGGNVAPKESASATAAAHEGRKSASMAESSRKQNIPQSQEASSNTRAGTRSNHSASSSSGKRSSSFIPRKFKRRLTSMLHFDFELPDIHLPSIPLPSLPTLTIPSWRATDAHQLRDAEAALMNGCIYDSRFVAGLNTLFLSNVATFTLPLLTQKEGRSNDEDGQDVDSCDEVDEEVLSDVDERTWLPSTPLLLKSPTAIPIGEGAESAFTLTEATEDRTLSNAEQASPSSSSGAGTTHREIVVLVHGFGGGVAMWAQNWNSIAEVADVCGFDLPGFARSTREKKRVANFTAPQETIDYYCSKFTEWFESMHFRQPVILCGHSFGAYLSSFFVTQLAKKYKASGDTSPFPVKHLILADPWGIELLPRETMKREIKSMSTRDKIICKMFYLFTPLSGLRAAGPAGPKLVPMIRPDIADGWSGVQRQKFFEYIYHCNAQVPPAGELAFRACCKYAGHPQVAAGPELIAHLPGNVSLTLMYGQKTMMDSAAGWRVIESLWTQRHHRHVKWIEISNAGHQIFSENAKEFNYHMQRIIAAEGQKSKSC